MVERLGRGVLMLIPHEEFSNRWIERVLRAGKLCVFAALVKLERPDLCATSQALEQWLGSDGIAGGSISGKQTLSIEAGPPAAVYEIDEGPDSDDGDENCDNGDNAGDVPPSQDASSRSASVDRLRQVSLLELSHPIATVG